MSRSMRPIWALAVLIIAGAVAALRLSGIGLVVGTAELQLALGGLFCLGAEFHHSRARAPAIAVSLRIVAAVGLFMAISLAGLLASYAVAARTSGWSDDLMVAADAALGFDWRVAYRLEQSHPAVIPVMRLAYAMISRMPFLVIVGLLLLGWDRRVAHFLRAYGLALTVTVVLFAFFPCRSALVQLIGTAPAYMPSTGTDQAMVIAGLRSGAINRLSIDGMIGIIGFPSFHVQAALLFTWAVWPLRAFRIPALIANAFMIAATPVEGAHYLIDVIAGAIIAAGSIFIVRLISAGSTPAVAVQPLVTVAQQPLVRA